MDAASKERWQAILLDYANDPRGACLPPDATPDLDYRDPATGDQIALTLEFDDAERIAWIAWRVSGSTLLRASASLMAETVADCTPAEAQARSEAFIAALTSPAGNGDAAWERLGPLEALRGIRHLPARVRCTSLPWRSLQQVLTQKAKASD